MASAMTSTPMVTTVRNQSGTMVYVASADGFGVVSGVAVSLLARRDGLAQRFTAAGNRFTPLSDVFRSGFLALADVLVGSLAPLRIVLTGGAGEFAALGANQ